MPALLTHDFFGRAVLDKVASQMGFTSFDERDAFLLGNQGPDPLFFLRVSPLMRKWAKLGTVMHSAHPLRLFEAAHRAQTQLEGRDHIIARAYLAGLACHYLLDRTAHPMVYFWQYGICKAGVAGLDNSHAELIHAEIERDLDEALLYQKTRRTIDQYRPFEEVLRANSSTLSSIDKVYFYISLWGYDHLIDPRTFSTSVRKYRLIELVAYSPTGKKRRVLNRLERLATQSDFALSSVLSHRNRASEFSAFDNHEHKIWEDPFTHEQSNASFWDIFEQVQDEVLPTLDLLFAEEFDRCKVAACLRDLNFEGTPTAPDAAVIW